MASICLFACLVSQPQYKNILLRVKMFLYILAIVIVSLDSFSLATPCEKCGSCIPILEYCNVQDDNVMENLVIDQSISAASSGPFGSSPNAPNLKLEESRERCLVESFLAVGKDRPSRNLKCQVKLIILFDVN